MKALRSLVILGILCALPVIAMWSKIRPRLGPWADDVEASITEFLKQTDESNTPSIAVVDPVDLTPVASAAVQQVDVESLPLPGEAAPQATPSASATATRTAKAKPPASNYLPEPRPLASSTSSSASASSAYQTAESAPNKPKRRTLERPVYRPLAGDQADTIERQTNLDNTTPTDEGHAAARLDAAKITDRLQQLGAAGYRLQTDGRTGDYHFEASFADPAQPEGVRRFSARDTDGQLAMREVLEKVEHWQETR